MLGALRLRYRSFHQFHKLLTSVLNTPNEPSFNPRNFQRDINFKRRSLPNFNEGAYGSRLHPPSAIEHAEERIRSHLSERSFKGTEDWKEVYTELMTDLDILTDMNYSSIMMNCLLALNKVQEAHSFMEYLEHVQIEPNFLTYLKYMALCGRNVGVCGQEVILETFKKVRIHLDAALVLDMKRVEHVVEGLCATDQWRLSLGYLKKTTHAPHSLIKNCITSAAIRNGDEELAWEVLTKWFRNEENLSNNVIKEFVLFAQKTDERRAERLMTDLFLYIQQKGFIMDEDTAKLVGEFFAKGLRNWQVMYTKVSRFGKCKGCCKSLEVVDFTDEDFILLRNSFLKRSLQKGDLFYNTTKKEFEQYIHFLHSHEPFDVVLDGLNTAYTSPLGKNRVCLAKQLLKVVEHFSRSSSRLLVLGKYHMKYWPQRVMEKISNKATLFYTSNISQDDPYMVHAALASGPHCRILSGDLMRDHVSRLDNPKLIWLFKRWQQTHQIFLEIDEKENKLRFTEPLGHSINIQGNLQDGWHIPFDDKIILDPYEELNNWICIKNIKGK